MAGKFGVKETEDVLDLVLGCVAMEIVKEIKKDGFQWKDLGAFLKSESFDAALSEAVMGISDVPSELTEVDLFDGISLGRHAYTLVVDLMEQLKK